MTINQLFRKKPTPETIIQILNLYNISSLEDTKSFTKKDLILFDTVQKINDNNILFYDLYLPCKAKIYLTDLTEKKVITILRQILKLFKHNLKSTEKYFQGEKMIEYNIYSTYKKEETNLEEKCVISFD